MSPRDEGRSAPLTARADQSQTRQATGRIVGTDQPQKDLVPKITGRARYAEDFRAEGMLFAKLFLSPMPRARVRRIDARRALAMDGVVAVLTPDDVPDVDAPGEPVLSREPVYQGQPIAAVAAVDETTAAEAVARLQVDLEPLPFVLDPIESLRPGGPDARSEGNVYRDRDIESLKWSAAQMAELDRGRRPEGVDAPMEWSFGDLDAAFAESELILDEPIVHQSQTHHPLESRTAMAYWRNGKCFLHCSTQSVSQTKRGHAQALGLEEEDLVLISEYTGGAFGSKIRGTVTDLIPAFLSRKAGRPVMMRVTRDEETYFGRARAGLGGWARIGFRGDGRVLALDVFLIQDNGPFGRQGDVAMFGNVAALTYTPKAMRHRMVPVLTNTPPRAAQRAPGGVQATAMLEPLMDKAARELGVDRLAMMRLNAPDHDTRFGPGETRLTSAFVREAIDQGARLFDWETKKAMSGARNGSRVTGVGVALAPFVGGSSGFDGLMVIRPDGHLYVHQGIGNLGSHSNIDTARAAADVLGMPWDRIEIVWGDTSRGLPWSSSQSGSQTTHAHTRANHAAAMDAREKLQEIAARDLGGRPADYDVGNGRVFRRGNPSVGLTFGRAAERAIALGGRYDGHEVADDLNQMTKHAVDHLKGQGLIGAARDNYSHDGSTWSFVVTFCRVEVDHETGMVEVKEVLATTDCGTVLNPRSLAAQLHGGVVQGMSVARFETWAFDPRWGVNKNKRFYTAKPVSILDVPLEMGWGAVNEPDPQTPVGAKGIGEPPIGAGAGAVISAITDAMGGIYVNRTPLTPDRILNALAGGRGGYGPLQTHV
jgi:CO/xanthine dehydrogenase Mo-binding subunit